MTLERINLSTVVIKKLKKKLINFENILEKIANLGENENMLQKIAYLGQNESFEGGHQEGDKDTNEKVTHNG